jgi:chemotaxis protein CheD
MIVSQQSKAETQPAAGAVAIRVVVGLEEIHVSRDPNVVLACLGLGSCVAVSGYDPVARVGAMAHVVLPDSDSKNKGGAPGKYADTGIPWMVEQMEEEGALKSRIAIKIAGGARMFANVKEGSLLDIGFRNMAAVKKAISDNGLYLAGENTGESHGRSLLLYVASGLTMVTSAVKGKIEI